MKPLVALLLMSGILMQVFSKQLAVAEYNLNKKFISSVLCINKNNPALHCQGKCHLKQELAKDDESRPVRDSKSKSGVETFWISGTILCLTFSETSGTQVPCGFIENFIQDYTNDIFHPPGSVCV